MFCSFVFSSNPVDDSKMTAQGRTGKGKGKTSRKIGYL